MLSAGRVPVTRKCSPGDWRAADQCNYLNLINKNKSNKVKLSLIKLDDLRV